jgi:thiamine pyrophosphate-dependent acetolactate synthase large subunit-like protein
MESNRSLSYDESVGATAAGGYFKATGKPGVSFGNKMDRE